MLTTEQLLQRLDQAIKAITTTDLGQTKLSVEKASRFVRAMENKAKILPEVRRIDMTSHTRDIDRVSFGQRILMAATEATAPGSDSPKPTFVNNKLVAVEAIAVVGLTYSTLEDNIEREDFEDTLIDMMGERAGLDLEELFTQGDSASGDTYLALTDGWLKLAGNAVSGTIADTAGGMDTTLSAKAGAGTSILTLTDETGIAQDDYVRIGAGLTQEYFQVSAVDGVNNKITINGQLRYTHDAGEAVVEIDAAPDFNPRNPESLFEALLNALPQQYKQDPSQLRIWTTWEVENDYRDVLRSRGTALGDQAQRDADPVSYKGIPIKVSANIPAGRALLSHPDNVVYGVYRDILMEPDRQPKARKVDFVLTTRVDANFEDEDGAVAATGYLGM